jgi:signal peptidase I
LKKIIYKISLVFYLYVGFCLFICMLPFFNPIFHLFSFSFKTIIGESMLPTIKEGDLVICRSYNEGKDELKEGMIIMFRDEDEKNKRISIIHRIIELKKDWVVTLGDNNGNDYDGLVKYSDIHGIYSFHLSGHYLGIGQIRKFLFLFADSLTEKIFIFPVYFYQIFFFLILFICVAIKRKKAEEIKAKI